MGKDPDILTEYVRQKLSRSIVNNYTDEEGGLSVLTISTQIEDLMRESIQQSDQGSFMNLEPNLAQTILESTQKLVDKISNEGHQPIVICSPVVRRHFRQLMERFMPQVMVLSHNELTTQSKLQSLGTIELNQRK
jgi:flagellar biosynthesis protein FlhA